jgi:hypothetical protein
MIDRMWKKQLIETSISLLFWSYSYFNLRATELCASFSFSSILNIFFLELFPVVNPVQRGYALLSPFINTDIIAVFENEV